MDFIGSGYSEKQNTAGVIRVSCCILFLSFSFSYLFFIKGDILAEAQYVFSNGLTTYNILVGAMLIPLLLQVVQWVVGIISRLPAKVHALSYLPSFLLLTIVTDLNRDVIAHFSFGSWVWVAPLTLIVYAFIVVVARKIFADRNAAFADLRSQLYPNFIILFVMVLLTGGIPQSTDVFHFELKAERHIMEGDYEAAAKVGEHSLSTSVRLSQLRAFALSQQGMLAERLFDYPQPYGSRGLLNVCDSDSTYRVSAEDICVHLGAICGKSVGSTDRYYELLLADSAWNQHTVDYYLCSLLLDKKLKEFKRKLPLYYNLSDSVAGAYDKLPKAYREALLVAHDRNAALDGHLVSGNDTIASFSDQVFVQEFRDYVALKDSTKNNTERVNRTRRKFGNTYWWYYDFQQ